ncbi:protein of unknown function [Taphrina deformans PYCC 5710]|uniref:Elongation factor 1-beta n=1 Tax=Taphrina deformans (strain PYCC 5710 / ATCC 11124 / CBS 356.35 / IMI 108563 / JCM 9778 / NBRC 8474) TaxID=1097556 RepID=R4XE86_TAPDE|nr:protein of unknown function [Taphrina deformans PYCC 5710]|eukprot:CCG84137.1 protein of unknown function [Taphrina deformans PYCC 5710]
MGFDLSSSISGLESHLATRSYIEGFEPSQADVALFNELKTAPSASEYPHAARWYEHIASYTEEHGSLPGDSSKPYSSYGPETSASEATKEAAPAADEDDIDLFGSDDDEEEDQAAIDLREKRLAEYAAKKAGKEKPAAKSVVTMDVKPWDDETDMKELEASVRSITMDGLVWGGGKLVPVGYGVSKLQINLVIEDDKVGLDDLQDAIAEFEDYVQSSDIAAMQKL